MRLSVIGCGYLGAVHAVCMALLGHDVIGVDVDADRVAALAAGRAPIYEPGLDQALGQALTTGRLRFTTDAAAIRDRQVHFVAVGTPQRPGGYGADLAALWSAVDALSRHARAQPEGPCLVVGKSTVPVGTARQVAGALAATGEGTVLVWNPEFLREGHALTDTLEPDRIVYGLPESEAEAAYGTAALDEVYAPLLEAGIERLVMNYPSAELVKVAANSFLATKISFINSMAELCEASGADVVSLADALGRDERIGPKFLRAGIGFGGGCLPKDIRAFMARAGELGVTESLTFLREVDSVNRRRRDHAVEAAVTLLGGAVTGARIAVLGLAFKPDSDDVRDSPALDIARRLAGMGAQVVGTDPVAIASAQRVAPALDYDDTDGALAGADLVLLLTEWREYLDLDPTRVADRVARPVIYDGRNALDPRRWLEAGWTYRGVGRHVPLPGPSIAATGPARLVARPA